MISRVGSIAILLILKAVSAQNIFPMKSIGQNLTNVLNITDV